MRKLVAVLTVSAAVAAFGAAAAGAVPNPSGTGQPSAECGAAGATLMPHGFSTDGFARAEQVYAGSPDTPSAANGSDHAVSQYDVACVQFTSAHTR
jgi:hypothetical protein